MPDICLSLLNKQLSVAVKYNITVELSQREQSISLTDTGLPRYLYHVYTLKSQEF